MVSVGDSFKARLKAEYPSLRVEWNNRECHFEVIEKYYQGAAPRERVIWQYENADGTILPFSGEHCMEALHAMDTRRWPLPERIRLAREERKKFLESQQREIRDKLTDVVADDGIYFSSSSMFFMDPSSMPEWKSKYRPSQERILRSRGEA